MDTTDGLTLSEHDGFTVATLGGEIDVANAIELETELTWPSRTPRSA